MNSKTSRDDRFIVSMIKNGFENVSVSEFISARCDWKYLLENSVREGVFFPFYNNLLAIDAQGRMIPDEFREQFRQTYYLHIAKGADFINRAERVFKRLDSIKIKTLLFKGPAVDSLIYDGFYRPRLDLDIAVMDEKIAEFENMPHDPEEITVHIHRHLINNTFLTYDGSLGMDMARVWEETEAFNGYGSIVTLKPEINILYLCDHALKHDFDQLVFLYEIQRLIAYYGSRLDWKKLVSMAREFRMERLIYYGLYLVKEMLSGDVPDDVIMAVKPKKFSIAENIFIRDIMNRKIRRYSSYAVYLASREGILKKTKFLFSTAFPRRITTKDNLARIGKSILR